MYTIAGNSYAPPVSCRSIDETIEVLESTAGIIIQKPISIADSYTVYCDAEHYLKLADTFEEALQYANQLIEKWPNH